MPSTPSILSDTTTNFQGYPELATKVDENPVVDADLVEFVGAAYPNFVDSCLTDLNAAAKGQAPWTDSSSMARFAGAPATGWSSGANDLVVGDGVGSRGLSVFSAATETGYLFFREPASQIAGGLSYDHDAKALSLWAEDSAEIIVDKTSLRPRVAAGSQLGHVDYPFKRLELRGNAILDATAGGSAYVLFRDNGSNAFGFWKTTTDDLQINNYQNSNEVALKVPAGGGITIGASGGDVGFFGESPAAKPTVTGSRGGNAALASLLTALEDLGLIVDSTT